MAVEPLSPQLGAKWQNEVAEHAVKVFEERLRTILTNYMQDGYLPLTFPVTGKEREAFLLSPEAVQQAEKMMLDQDATAREQGLALWEEIQEARNGQAQG